MQKKLLAVAVAGALVAPAAFAQTSVTISGALNLWYESMGATGATNGSTAAGVSRDVLRRDRISDGAGSNIRFAVTEDLGSGMQAFAQVETAVFNNADTRNNSFAASPTAAPTGIQTAGGWATRNSGVGLRGSSWGEILMGIWDVHYNETYAVDTQLLTGASHSSSLALLQNFGNAGNLSGGVGSIGTRYSNTIRYASPTWGGFSFNASYTRPTDSGAGTIAGQSASVPNTPVDNKKNTIFNFAPKYNANGIHVSWSYFRERDAVSTVGATAWSGAALGGTAVPAGALGLSNNNITSNRLQAGYAFPMGISIAVIYDQSKWENSGNGAAAVGTTIKRDVWAFPLKYSTGPHSVFFTYARAKNWKGNIGGVDLGSITVTPAPGGVAGSPIGLGGDTGARFLSIGYQYALSKRTNIHLNYSEIRNDALAGYDFFANTAGMTNGAGVASFGADPKVYSIGLRHAF